VRAIAAIFAARYGSEAENANSAAQRSWNFEVEAKISMARGLRDHRARRIDARPDHHTFIDRTLESEHRTAKVAPL
jgi:hypothetical protein